MGLRETIKRILREETKIPTELRRRIFLVHRVIDKLLPNMYVCDYNSADHFVTGVLDEITLFRRGVEELKSIERIDIENYILDYKYDELVEYFNERCTNKNLQESIRRILREELESREVESIESNDELYEIEKDEQTEGELTEKCWKGYTKKGMKTMFGKRYPNCVKKTK